MSGSKKDKENNEISCENLKQLILNIIENYS